MLMNTMLILASVSGLLGTPGGATPNGATPTDPPIIGIHYLAEWRSVRGQQVAHMFEVIEWSCAHELRRLLFETDSGDRVLLDRRHRPDTGRIETRLTDDATGWWIELRETSDAAKLAIEHPSQFSASLLWQQRRWLEADHAIERALVIQGETAVNLGSTVRDAELDQALFDRLDAAQGSALRSSTPKAVQRVVQVLHSVLTSTDADGTSLAQFRSLLDPLAVFIARMEERDHGPPTTRWHHRTVVAGGGTHVVEGTKLAFVSGFDAITIPGDPLRGKHAPPDGGCPTTTHKE